MRIFKNRGDIYFSKANKQKSNEQKILIIALLSIVVFTIAFVGILGYKYDFSMKKFFAPESIDQSLIVTVDEEEPLPQVSGKHNFILMITEENNLLFSLLIQGDMDNISYKVCTLKADTIIEGNSLKELYKQSGEQNVKNAVESQIGVEFEYYIVMTQSGFSDFIDDIGYTNFPILSEIRYKSENKDVDFSLRLRAGDQSLNGNQIINLVRYYIEEENNTSAANDLILNGLLQNINDENFEKREDLFKSFITSANTNITVRDFSLADDELTVLSNHRTGAGAYSAIAEYDENSITQDSLQKLKGYFVK